MLISHLCNCWVCSGTYIFMEYSWFTVLCWFHVYSKMKSVMHIHISTLFQITFLYRSLEYWVKFPLLYSSVQSLSHVWLFVIPWPPCPSPTPGVHSDSRPLSHWCHPAISFSVVPFSSCPQSRPASQSFPISQIFAWGGQNTGASALASFLPKKSQGWSPSEWTGWISLQSKGL